METSIWGKHVWHCEIQLLRAMFFRPCSGLSLPLGKTLFCKMLHIRTHIYNKHVHVQILPKHVHTKETVKTILHNMFPLLEYVQLAFLQRFKSFHIIPTTWPPSAKSARKRPPCTRQDSLSQDSSFSQHKQGWLSKGNKRIAVQLSLSTNTTIKCGNHIIASVSIWGCLVMQHTIPTVYLLTVIS